MADGGFVKTGDMDSVDGRKGRWQAHRQARRLELVQAAVRAIHRNGPHINMNDVAAAAKVTKPVLYRHFADQRELYHAVGQYAAEWLVAWLAQHLEPETEPTEVIATVIDAYLGAVETEPVLYRFVIRYAFADEANAVDGYRDIVVRHVDEMLRARLKAAGMDDSACHAWAQGIVGMVQSVGEWWLDRPDAATRPQLTQQLTALIWGGLSQAFP
ncbi:TetR/AcrR family transcriptional regulator [Stackebrandtia nassauensis]|uniref:Transcriptional regulator, TetR family n=1 Tax=Stackebrandtia nassauensis (strain DSM 44728 / CIP 108903 / NRRL B-16338 / NBRC 102104 / LLR-40K-21) TaxID=446470 RepID=D3QAA8_STANL|nr:TetR family transcriptional regulator [Stackebrandtia nassauensis]ADD42691.1 transcriptional regulator, TetR family [Stackebrandtia nassauensis DSM 44728]